MLERRNRSAEGDESETGKKGDEMPPLNRHVLHALSGLLVVSFVAAINAGQSLDVVSVRESAGGSGLPQFVFFPGRMEIAEWQLRGLVAFAFNIMVPASERQIEGWPDRTLPARRFTVRAAYSGVSTPALAVQQRLMREILEQRFRRRARVERREQPVYALRLIRPGTLRSGIVKVGYDCTDPETRTRRDVDCREGDRTDERGSVMRGSGPIGSLLARLQLELQDRLIVDQTGLDGFYKWELLRWERLGDGVPRPAPPPLRDVLATQAGLTIADTRALIDVVIIEAISMPTPN